MGDLHRIRKRADGACGFLSPENRCRLHEELGGDKPFTCRVFPFSFHVAPDAVVVKASSGCPSIVANAGAPMSSGETLAQLGVLRDEWFAGHPAAGAPQSYIEGRAIGAASLRILRENLLRMLDRTAGGAPDLRANVRRMAGVLEDLSRLRVVRLPDEGFADYLALTTRHAAVVDAPAGPRPPTRTGRLLQHGFLFVVAATRLAEEQRGRSRLALRLATLRLLAHFHRLAPGHGRVDVSVLSRARVDVNAPEVQPIVHRYLRASIETLGAGERPVLDELATAVSYLNAACALAVMDAAASGRPVDGALFSEALMEAVGLSQSDPRGLPARSLRMFADGVEALYSFGWTPGP